MDKLKTWMAISKCVDAVNASTTPSNAHPRAHEFSYANYSTVEKF